MTHSTERASGSEQPAPPDTNAQAAGKRPLRVALVVPAMDTGGMEVMVLALAIELRRNGHDAGIICTEHEGDLAHRVRDYDVPLSCIETRGRGSLLRPHRLAAYLRERNVDVVHSHSGVCVKASRAARIAGTRAIVHTRHGIQTPQAPTDLAFLLLGALLTDATVGCSSDVVAYYRRWLPWRSGISLIANGVDAKTLEDPPHSLPLRTEFRIPDGARVLGTIARLHPVKNQQLLIEAIALLGPQWHLILVGDGPLREQLEAQAQAEGVSTRVHFAGKRTVSFSSYRSFDVFALSSISEAMPMTVLEAFCSEVPVVVPHVGGLPTLVRQGELGLLYTSGNAEELASCVRATFDDAEATRVRVDRARASFLSRHTVGAMTDSYMSLYRSLLERIP